MARPRLPFCALAGFVLSAALSPVLAASWQDDYAQLTAGVEVLEMSGTAGSVAILGNLAFPVALSPQRQAPAGCGYAADTPSGGRVAALAHTSLAGGATPAMQRWLGNLLRWTGRSSEPTLLLLGGSAKDWRPTGANLVSPPKTWDPALLRGVHCVLLNLHTVPPDLAAAAAEDLVAFNQSGGGIIVVSTPWAARNELLELASRLLRPAGLAFLNAGPSDAQYPLSAPPPAHASALRALAVLQEAPPPDKPLPLDLRQGAAATLEACLAANLVSEPLEKALLQLHQKNGWSAFHAGEPLRKNLNPVGALLARFEAWWLQRQPPQKTPPHPLAADYPGLPAEGPAQTRTVRFNATTGPDKLINHGGRTRIATGLYARPGVPIKVSVSPQAAQAGWKVEIGIHSDKNWNLPVWRRFPEISTVTPLAQPETLAVNSFGGLVHLLLPPDCALGASEALIEGALQAPVFSLGKTSPEEWAALRNAPGAWGYLETPLWTGYFSRAQLQTLDAPEKIASYWHDAVATADHFLGYAPWRRRGESMLVDRDLFVGYGHAGYPVMMAYGAEKGDGPNALLARGPQRGDWGFLHELGHTFQDSFDGHYTIATHAEVDVNLVPALVLQKLHGRLSYDNTSHGTFDAAPRIAAWDTWNALPETERTWERACKMHVGYDFYFTLAECFGWELYARSFGRWMNWLQKSGADPSLDAFPDNTPAAKRDRFFVLFSEESAHNLLPYFLKYGLGRNGFELSPEARLRVAHLPPWSGNRPVEAVLGPQRLTIQQNAATGLELARFSGRDPDPGTLFRYALLEGNADGAFSLDEKTGALVLQKNGLLASRKLVVEARDNCIPLSSARLVCEVDFR